MRRQLLLRTLAVLLLGPVGALAQLTAPNDAGVAIGHIHLLSKDPDAQKKIWIEALGAQPAKTGRLDMLKLPGVFIIIDKADPAGSSTGSTADHIGFSVKSLDAIKAKLAALNVPVEGPFARRYAPRSSHGVQCGSATPVVCENFRSRECDAPESAVCNVQR